MFFRLPVVRFFNRVINRAAVTVALVLLQIGWLLWAFFSLTAGKVWVNAGLNVLSLFITLYLVRKDENSDYKIIWLVLIGMMPLLGGALYLAFGNKAPAKRMRQRMQAVERQHTADLAQQPGQTDALDPASRGLSRYVSEYGPYPAWKNSTAKYYPCGEAMYPDLLADLEKAERFIFLEFFIVRTGKMWKGVEDILVRKAAQGVDVRLIYDDFGSLLGLPSDFVVQMERAHIRCIPFNPVVPLVSLVMNHRDHRKIVVVDGNTAYTGGINLADEYINEEERFGYWKDAALRTEGAAVWNFTVMFLDHWNAFRPSEEDYAPFMPQAESLSAQSDGVIQPYGDSPLDEEALAETVYLNIINQAQRYVYIYTPYFAVGETMLEALKAAAKRGVDVRLVLPGIPDKKLIFRLTRSYYVPLLRAGVRIYEFTPGFLHAKCYVSDDRAAVVGSINNLINSLFTYLFINQPRTWYKPSSYVLSLLLSFNQGSESTEVFDTTIGTCAQEYIIDRMTLQFFAWLEAHIVQALLETSLLFLRNLIKSWDILCDTDTHTWVGTVGDAWFDILCLESQLLVEDSVIATLQGLPVSHSLVPLFTLRCIFTTLDVLECGLIRSYETTTGTHLDREVAEGETTFH